MRRCSVLAAVLAALLGVSARAELCSDAQSQQIDALYVAVANSPQCSEYAAVLPWSVMVWWSCDNDACVTVMRQLAQALPDCEDPSGANAKTTLAESVAGCGGGAATSASASASDGESPATSDSSSSDVPANSTEASASASTETLNSDSRSSSASKSGARLRSEDLTDSARSSDAEEA
jgi:hypothetical protein